MLVGHKRANLATTPAGSRLALLRLGCAIAVLATFVASCVGTGDRAWGSQRIAIQILDGQPTLLLYSCPEGKPITSVTVVKHDIHADTDKILWQVSRAGATPAAAERVERLTIGKSAAGYQTVTPLVGTLPSTPLDVKLTRVRPDGVVDFETSQLSATALRVDQTWFDGRRSVDLNEFMRVNRKNC